MFKAILGTIVLFIGSQSAFGKTVSFVVETTGLSSMKGQHYEGWNILNGAALSTGRFSVEADGSVYEVDASGEKLRMAGQNGEGVFQVDEKQRKSSLFVLTIEPNNDPSDKPSSVHIMGGSYKSQRAELSIGHGSSIGSDFSSAQGSYILAAPTGGDFNQGVWFVDPAKGMGSLDLPDLATGWAYEGWIVNTKNNQKFSTGVFRDSNNPDSDNAGLFAGNMKLDFPPVPGQDIVKTPVTLNDGIHAIVVTVEPYPDFDPAPYDLKILKADVATDAMGMTSLNLDNISDNTRPSGVAHFH